ncbi:ABC transporter permease [Rhodococcus zopfii]|uniref:ABC transporter permease n=1 Tax=Rhodococcus zopfii TaxID=43772 RepID=UPI001486105B|nr:ABC transporter permease [Rhodococcus zopfii]
MAIATTRAKESGSTSETRRSQAWFQHQAVPIIGATIALFVLCALFVPGSVTGLSLNAMLPLAAVLAVASVGQAIVIRQRGIDLSVGGTMTLCAVVLAWFSTRHAVPLAITLLVVAMTAVSIGTINGILVARFKVTPLIATLAVNSIATGAVWTYSKGFQADVPSSVNSFATSKLAGIPVLAWIVVVVIVLVAVITSRTVLGRRYTAIGANPRTAHAAGLPVDSYVIGSYVAAAVLFGVAGVLLAGYVKTISTGLGASYMLPTIAAVIVGGTALTGGKGSIIATAVAALFLTQLVQMVLTLGAPSSVQLLIQAAAIAIAAAIRGVRWSALTGRGRAQTRS